MNKAIFSCSLVCVLFLLVGTYAFPSNPIMWLAGTSMTYVIFRVITAVALVAVLLTNPPRQWYMRMFMGLVAVALATAGITIGVSDSVQILDMVLFLELAVAFGIEALEFNEEELQADILSLREKYVQEIAPSSQLVRLQAERTVAASAQGL
jgi:hypothetical protein